MNLDEKDNRRISWPGRRAALIRLLLITSVVFPLSWAVNALLVGSWNLLGDRNAESMRHLVEWTVIWVATVCVVFLASLLPALHRRFSARFVRRMFIVLAWMVTIFAVLYAEENWRGSRAWNKYRQQLEANGAQLRYPLFIPQPVPDDQNFAATPVVKSWFVEIDKTIFTNTTERFANRWDDDYQKAHAKISSSKDGRATRQFIDLVAWDQAFRAIRLGEANANQEFKSDKLDRESRAAAAPGVLAGLKSNEAALAELRAASERPYARYPVVYDMDNPWGIFLPHLKNVRDACQRLGLKACAKLAAGRSDDALADVKLMLYLADTLKDEPFLISYVVRLAAIQLAVQPVWEGLAEHRWTAGQLQELQSRWLGYDFVADMQRPLDGERAAGILTADLVRKKGLGLLVALIGPGAPTSMDRKVANWWGGLIPRGWYAQEQLNYCRLYEMQLQGAFDPARKTISPSRVATNTHELERQISSGSLGKTLDAFLSHRVIAALLLPSLHKIPLKAAGAQAAVDQTALACALERYRLAQGKFPEKLEALAPQFIPKLPNDPLTGEPYQYRRTEDGQFALYSVGWNEKDDRGVPGKTLFDDKEGDWVWTFPAK